jgi:23S rRNA U2552 (ribose-2'-O)-methylase RlmE/FtsJ
VHIIQGDFTTHLPLLATRYTLILSDVAPSFSGARSTDSSRVNGLVLDGLVRSVILEKGVLERGGAFVTKFMRGVDEDELKAVLESNFKTVSLFKVINIISDSFGFLYF